MPRIHVSSLEDMPSTAVALRASHLITHIETTRLLTADQITRYDHLRGYAGATSGGGGHHGGAGHGNHSGHAH